MFVFAMVVIGVVCCIVVCIRETKSERDHRRRAKENGQFGYADRNGILRSVDTNEPVMRIRAEDGDVWEINPYTKERLKNISNDIRTTSRKYEYDNAVKEGRRVFQIESGKDYLCGRGSGHNRLFDKFYMYGCYYADVTTGELYVKRLHFGKPFYIGVRSQRAEFFDLQGEKAKLGKTIAYNENDSAWCWTYIIPKELFCQYIIELKETEYLNGNGVCTFKSVVGSPINIMEIEWSDISYKCKKYANTKLYKVMAGEVVKKWLDFEIEYLNAIIEERIQNVKHGKNNTPWSYDVYLNDMYEDTTDNYLIGEPAIETERKSYLMQLEAREDK